MTLLKKIAVKVVDIFENDNMRMVEIGKWVAK